MTQEEKELLIKDLSGRIPYRHNLWLLVREFDEDSPSNRRLFTNYIDEIDNGWVVECKPYLRPISSMTEDEEKQFQDVNLYELPYTVEGLDWLNAHHFDYRGLINDGLALEASKGMYKN